MRKRLEPDGNLPVEDDYDNVPLTGADGEDVELVGLLVSKPCRHLIQEFLGYKEEHVGTSQAVDHCLDSLRYACMEGRAAGKEPTKKRVVHRSGRADRLGSKTIRRPKSGESQ